MAIKEIYSLRIIASFGSLRKSKSDAVIILAISIIGLGLVPAIFSEGSFYGNLIVEVLLQYPILLIFPFLFLSSALVSKMNVTEYERDFIFSAMVRPSEFLIAKTLYDLTMVSFLFFAPLLIPFILSIIFFKIFYVLLFSSILIILIISVLLENSFKTLILFYNKNIVRASILLIMILFSLPLLDTLYPKILPVWLYYVSPVGCLQVLLMGKSFIIPILSISLWAIFSMVLLFKASNLNFIPFVQVVPLRTMFDISLASQVRKQKYVLSRVSSFSIPIGLHSAPKNSVLFYVKESITRTFRFGDLYAILLTTFFLYLPYIFFKPYLSNIYGFYRLTFSPAYFIIIFYPLIFTQLWFTEFGECVWMIKAYSKEFLSYSVGLFFWQLSIALPIIFVIGIIESIINASNLILSLTFPTLTLIVNAAFGIFYTFWLLKRKAFTSLMFFIGIIFYILLSTPILLLLLIKELFIIPFNLVLDLLSIIYSVASAFIFVYKAGKIFEEIEV